MVLVRTKIRIFKENEDKLLTRVSLVFPISCKVTGLNIKEGSCINDLYNQFEACSAQII